MNAEGARCGLERHGGDRRGRHHYQRLPSGDRLMGAGDVTAGFAAIDGLELYYETRGAGRPLVLIHGALMTIGLMKDYPARLAASRQVIAVELQAHGHTGDVDQLQDSPYHQAYQAVAPDPRRWPALVAKIFDLDAQPQDWPAEQVAAITAPTMLIVADNDIVRLEHAVEMIHLLGGGIVGDLHGVPESRLAVIPGTTHTGLCDRAAWVVPMVEEFLGGGNPA